MLDTNLTNLPSEFSLFFTDFIAPVVVSVVSFWLGMWLMKKWLKFRS